MSPPTPSDSWHGNGRRIEAIDALRGLALFGILQVNIQSFTWGASEPLGYLQQPPAWGESILYFLQAAFFEGKFYPIFAFLFGVGMAMQLRKLRARTPRSGEEALWAYRRRLFFLLILGLLHGALLYSGDVLAAYAICALIFVEIVAPRPRSFALFAFACGVLAVLSEFAPILFDAVLETTEPASEVPMSLQLGHAVYTHGGFLEQVSQRWSDEAMQQLWSIPAFWPQVLAFLSLGWIAARRGWLEFPEQHPKVWKRAREIGLLLGLPCSLLGAALSVDEARNAPASTGEWDGVLLGFSSLLAAAYVAWALRAFRQPWGGHIRELLACAGRMSLTNYLLQSLCMGALLSGWGLGLGANASRGQLAAWGLLLFSAQVALSRFLLSRFRQGPVEALWRRWTYGRTDRSR